MKKTLSSLVVWVFIASGVGAQIAPITTTNGVYMAPSASTLWSVNFLTLAQSAFEPLNAGKYQVTNSVLTALAANPNLYQATNSALSALAANPSLYQATNAALTALASNPSLYQATNATLTTVASLGAINLTNATSLAIPADNNPTTDSAGEIAIDRNNDFVEVYAATAGESRVIPTLQFRSYTIIDPDGVQAVKDAIPLLPVETAWAPHGITIKDIWIKIDAAVSYTAVLEEWSDPTTYGSDIESLTISSGTEVKDDGTLSDASVAAGSIIFVDLPTTAVNFLTVSFSFIINPGN